MRPYEDRDHMFKHHSRHHYYEYWAREYEQYYHAQKSKSELRLRLLEQLGIIYDANREMYIRGSDGTSLWT